ncbi:Uncharacterised protein [Providencia rustigianii]|uniref:YdgH/BhsA/McbA-like domain-containing protein n=3 Tax=Providencia rustigianii TaxID=158850 RepID=D1P553_9GAMM|nr:MULTISPECIES: hypothetical protein [Providencia]EFB71414.1 hypothetical protein PROVRUST_07358 [Providencia rustigianii DSM 4541]MTC57705.1 hypothetical protein [Providencia rustigianii]SPY77801.1 Uncharacterised protein [Providencia rustigianii]SUC35788.1 Uncharacterised protein [Providencia rustigianii]VEB70398.1 Uncharacterised protein [Providencia rustigianii]
MKLSKSIIIASSLLAISFSTFAYHGNGTGHGSWPNHNNHTQAQYERPCSNYADGRHSGRHQAAMQYSTTIQTTQPEETLKKISSDLPKGENGKQYRVHVAVIDAETNAPIQNQ